ncbi:quinolinate synthase NadA [Candidatus Woesearchaeota archaeon]|nr:quinolinate synthase NadA [Candidatus Woesearchaeota archaeon]
MTRDLIDRAISEHPRAEIVVHPECNPDVTELADAVLSTSGMVEYARTSSANEFIIGTEKGLVDMLQRMFPDKTFHPIYNHKSCDESCVCPYMKSITIGKVRRALEQGTHEIIVPEDIRRKALKGIERMLALGRDT